jgi:hypothetical protein
VEKHRVSEENAHLFLEWLRTRGGIAVWNSLDLSNPGMSYTTPVNGDDGKPRRKPRWDVDDTPSRIITDIDEVEVATYKEVKRFHVATQRGCQGLMAKVTDGGTRRINAAVEKAGEGAFYTFDYFNYDNAVIWAPEKVVPLKEWADARG